jgi:hypothetical protein
MQVAVQTRHVSRSLVTIGFSMPLLKLAQRHGVTIDREGLCLIFKKKWEVNRSTQYSDSAEQQISIQQRTFKECFAVGCVLLARVFCCGDSVVVAPSLPFLAATTAFSLSFDCTSK